MVKCRFQEGHVVDSPTWEDRKDWTNTGELYNTRVNEVPSRTGGTHKDAYMDMRDMAVQLVRLVQLMPLVGSKTMYWTMSVDWYQVGRE